ncbi:serine/threonine-protein kinase, partial [Streptomyces sp. DSM 44915]
RQLLYPVMKHVQGRPLTPTPSQPLELWEITRWGSNLCRALTTAHHTGIVHRDLKPANVLVDEEGRAVVLDFGIARFLGETAELTRLTHTGATLGTPAYMSPEQAEGAADVDQRSDLYSLGCLLYELLTGYPPFVNGRAHVVLRMHIESLPVPPSALRPGLPAGWDALVLGLLAKRPADRPASARAVRERLAALPTESVPGAAFSGTGPVTRGPAPPRFTQPMPSRPVPPARGPGRRTVVKAAVAGIVMVLPGSLVANGYVLFAPYPWEEFLIALAVSGVLVGLWNRSWPSMPSGRVWLAAFVAFVLAFECGSLLTALSEQSGGAGSPRDLMIVVLTSGFVSLVLRAVIAPRKRYPFPFKGLDVATWLSHGLAGGLVCGIHPYVVFMWERNHGGLSNALISLTVAAVLVGHAVASSRLIRWWSPTGRAR